MAYKLNFASGIFCFHPHWGRKRGLWVGMQKKAGFSATCVPKYFALSLAEFLITTRNKSLQTESRQELARNDED